MGLSTPQNIKWMREAELKHGRMCQLAWMGYVAVDLGIKFPGERYADLTSYSAHDVVAKNELFFALLLVGTFETIGFTQVCSLWFSVIPSRGSDEALKTASSTAYPCMHRATQIYNMMEGDDDREPGDFGFDPLKLLKGESAGTCHLKPVPHSTISIFRQRGEVQNC
ncbi:MAG: hypothetical protein SGPRY_009557 [Prymnesium sp.]